MDGAIPRDRAAWRRTLAESLRVPLVAAPMFLVSAPKLVIETTRAGAIGSFPTLNARTPEILEAWLGEIAAACRDARAPWAANLVLHKKNARREADIDAVVRHRAPIAIASVGPPDPVVEAVQAYGGRVFCDVATLRHARRAIVAGVDGLILLTAGAGGHTGWLNPFAFLKAVRAIFDGPIAIAGGLTDGRQLRALKLLDADLGYVGTPFIATTESLAPQAYKDSLVAGGIDEVLETDVVSGMRANFLRPSLEAEGFLTPEGRPERPADVTKAAWDRVWSAGHGVGEIAAVRPAADLVAAFATEYGS